MGGPTETEMWSMSRITEASAESIIGHGCWFGLNLVPKSDFLPCWQQISLPWLITTSGCSNIDRSHPQIYQINHAVYRNFFDVTVVNGEYRIAESIKRVTVTGSYRIDRNGTVFIGMCIVSNLDAAYIKLV